MTEKKTQMNHRLSLIGSIVLHSAWVQINISFNYFSEYASYVD